MKTGLYQNSFITLLLAIGLCGCTSSPFATLPAEQQSATMPLLAKAGPKTTKRSVKSKGLAKPSASKFAPLILDVPGAAKTDNLWERMAQDFQIPITPENPAIQEQIQWFKQHQDYLNRTTKRAEPYMYLVYEQVQQRNLPVEVVLLPIIESAYYPLAYSGAGAAGLWQLMPGTASKFGLKRNGWYDGRRDIFASTTAALDYLSYLQNFFNGNWLLALAAYDAGEGTVQAAIRRNELAGKDTDFWSLKLPQETMTYVPRMLALASIIKHPEIYHIPLPAIDNHPYLGKVDVGSQIKLVDAAKLAGISLHELKKLNPGYSRWSTVPNGPSHLLLPLTKIDDFKENLAQLPRVRKTSWGKYKIQRGDTLEKIAERYNTSLVLMQRANHLNNNRSLVRGKIILVPAISQSVSSESLTTATDNVASTVTSEQHEIENKSLAANNIAAVSDTHEQIEADKSEDAPVKSRKLSYIIKPGETLSHVAKRFHVSVAQLIAWNKLPARKPLKPGMKLNILDNKTALSSKSLPLKKSASQRHYKVRDGDNLSKISHRLQISIPVLKKLNHLSSNALKPGMILRLPAV